MMHSGFSFTKSNNMKDNISTFLEHLGIKMNVEIAKNKEIEEIATVIHATVEITYVKCHQKERYNFHYLKRLNIFFQLLCR